MNIETTEKLDEILMESKVYYDNIDISYIIRNSIIGYYNSNNKIGSRTISINKNIILRFIKSSIITFHNIIKMKNIWVFSNAERRKKINGLYYDRVASIVSENSNTATFIENPVLVNHKKPTNDTVLSDALFYLGSFIFSFIFYKKDKLHLGKELLLYMNSLDVNLNIGFITKKFIGQYRYMRFFLKYIYKPKLVFTVYPNGYYGYNYAFKEFNIPIVELQHGIIYSQHPSYNSTLKNSDRLFKPDYIFTYGKRDKMIISKLNYVADKKCFVVGSYGLWKIKMDKSEVSKYLKNITSYCMKTLVVIATVNDIDELYSFCIKLEQLKDNLNILLLPRHKTLNLLDTKNVKVLDVQKTNVFETYKTADFLLTMSSTSALEALYMNIPTFILDKNGKSVFKRNYQYLHSFNYIKTELQLLNMISENSFNKPSEKDVEQVYAKDVITNFENALNIILKDSFF